MAGRGSGVNIANEAGKKTPRDDDDYGRVGQTGSRKSDCQKPV